MVKTILGVLSLLVMSSCSTVVKENTAQPDIMETNKKNLGNLLALYPISNNAETGKVEIKKHIREGLSPAVSSLVELILKFAHERRH